MPHSGGSAHDAGRVLRCPRSGGRSSSGRVAASPDVPGVTVPTGGRRQTFRRARATWRRRWTTPTVAAAPDATTIDRDRQWNRGKEKPTRASFPPPHRVAASRGRGSQSAVTADTVSSPRRAGSAGDGSPPGFHPAVIFSMSSMTAAPYFSSFAGPTPEMRPNSCNVVGAIRAIETRVLLSKTTYAGLPSRRSLRRSRNASNRGRDPRRGWGSRRRTPMPTSSEGRARDGARTRSDGPRLSAPVQWSVPPRTGSAPGPSRSTACTLARVIATWNTRRSSSTSSARRCGN